MSSTRPHAVSRSRRGSMNPSGGNCKSTATEAIATVATVATVVLRSYSTVAANPSNNVIDDYLGLHRIKVES